MAHETADGDDPRRLENSASTSGRAVFDQSAAADREVGGAPGPPIVKGGTPREARREKRTLTQADPAIGWPV